MTHSSFATLGSPQARPWPTLLGGRGVVGGGGVDEGSITFFHGMIDPFTRILMGTYTGIIYCIFVMDLTYV